MPTFPGAYVREPSDFATVTTEAGLIQLADDPDSPVLPDEAAFADLSAPEQAVVIAALTPIIERKEGIINGYLRAGGYVAPADANLNPQVVDYAVRLVFNALRYRKRQLTDGELSEADADVLAALDLIATGGSSIVTAEASAEEPTSGTVYAIGTSRRIMSRETLEDF